MSNEHKGSIKNLKNQINILEKQKQLLVDFIVSVPDCASSIMRSIKIENYDETKEKILDLGVAALAKLDEVGLLNKPAY